MELSKIIENPREVITNSNFLYLNTTIIGRLQPTRNLEQLLRRFCPRPNRQYIFNVNLSTKFDNKFCVEATDENTVLMYNVLMLLKKTNRYTHQNIKLIVRDNCPTREYSIIKGAFDLFNESDPRYSDLYVGPCVNGKKKSCMTQLRAPYYNFRKFYKFILNKQIAIPNTPEQLCTELQKRNIEIRQRVENGDFPKITLARKTVFDKCKAAGLFLFYEPDEFN